MVHAGGRPRETTPPPEECIKLGEDLVEWVSYQEKEDEKKRLLFSQWYCNKHKMIKTEWKALKQIPQFRPYYEQAKSLMALKSIDGTMEKTFGHRYIRYYDEELKEFEDEDKRQEAEMRSQTENQLQDLLVKIIDYSASKKE